MKMGGVSKGLTWIPSPEKARVSAHKVYKNSVRAILEVLLRMVYIAQVSGGKEMLSPTGSVADVVWTRV